LKSGSNNNVYRALKKAVDESRAALYRPHPEGAGSTDIDYDFRSTLSESVSPRADVGSAALYRPHPVGTGSADIDYDFRSTVSKSVSPHADVESLITTLCLVALRILELRKRLHVLGSHELTASTVPSLLAQLGTALRQSCPENILQAMPQMQIEIPQAAIAPLRSPVLNNVLLEDGALGWAYQFLCFDLRKQALTAIQSANKSTTNAQVISFTQLYTPQWIVEFLLANTVYCQWQGRAVTPIPTYERWLVRNESPARQAAALTTLDPACGAGNFLVTSLDLSIQMLIAEGHEFDDAADLAERSVFGADVDPIALWVSALALLLKRLQHTSKFPQTTFQLTNAIETDSQENYQLGSIYKGFSSPSILSCKYAAVVTNPPYIGRKLMSRELRTLLKENYPECHHDLAAAFVQRSLDWLADGGKFGVITQASVLSLPSYTKMRQAICDGHSISSAVTLGTSIFPLQGGDKVNSALLVIENSGAHANALMLDVSDAKDKPQALQDLLTEQKTGLNVGSIVNRQGIISGGIGLPSLPPVLQEMVAAAPKLTEIADVRQGLATSDNRRFVKELSEVDPTELGSIWQPYVKGAGSDRWESPIRYAVKWDDNGREIKEAVAEAYPYLKGNIKWVVKNEQFYFRPGLCFSFVNTKSLAVRKLPSGCIFDVGASALFVHDPNDEDFLLAYLNSSLMSAIAKTVNPTVNLQVGDIKKLPILMFRQTHKESLAKFAQASCALARSLHAAQPGFQKDLLEQELGRLEEQNSQYVLRALAELGKLDEQQMQEIREWISKKCPQQRQHLISNSSPLQ
jgi:hypothetical protein